MRLTSGRGRANTASSKNCSRAIVCARRKCWWWATIRDSEIAAGNRLGMQTIQILRPGVTRSNAAAAHVNNLTELKKFL